MMRQRNILWFVCITAMVILLAWAGPSWAQSPCAGGAYPIGDVDKDCVVRMDDLAKLAEEWLAEVQAPEVSGTAGAPPTADLVFINDGSGPGVIVTADAGTDSYETALWLRNKLASMTGVTLDMHTYYLPYIPTRRIVVGPEAAAYYGVSIDQTYPGVENHIIRRVSRKLILAGNDGGNYRGTWHAVMGWLDMLGYRIYDYEDPDYQITPQLSEVAVGAVDVEDQPVFTSRTMWASCSSGCSRKEYWWDWLGMGGDYLYTSHNEFIPTSECGDHPDYFSWNGSVRSAFVLEGTLNDSSDEDVGYTAEVALPWTDLGWMPLGSANRVGIDQCVNDRDHKEDGYRCSDWADTLKFHVPRDWGEMVFLDASP